MLREISFFLVVIFNFTLAQGVPSDSLKVILEQAKIHYYNGEYDNVINELENAVQSLKNSDLVEAYKYLAFSYIASGDKTMAMEKFKEALKIAPELELDPATVSPEIVEVFEKAKMEMVHEAAMCSCFIPGMGQMLKGEDSKAIMIMAASGVSLIASAISWTITIGKRDNYLDIGPGDPDAMNEAYDSYNFWYKTSVFTSAIFIGIYLYSIYDAASTKPKIKSTMNNSNKGFFCKLNKERIQIGYNISFQ